MKLKFIKQEYQTDAVNSIVDLFRGQERKNSIFSIVQNQQIGWNEKKYGIGNVQTISNEQMLQNMHAIQRRNTLKQTDNIMMTFPPVDKDSNSEEKRKERDIPSFCIDMETATGKTYVFTKTIFELNKEYGFTKFIIFVPSVAIREGVKKSLDVTAEHFADDYDNVPTHFFIYDSKKLTQIRDFATSSDIEIMIINIDAFRKSENLINQDNDKLNGVTAMRYIQDCSPIVIIDEPQSVDTTDKSQKAIADLNPLAVLRYSATHKNKVNTMYKLTPVDAYQKGLVKQICVSSNSVINDFNKPYMRLVSVKQDKGFSAKIEIDRIKNGVTKRETVTVKTGTEMLAISGGRDLYEPYVVSGFEVASGNEYVEFANYERLYMDKPMGDIDENVLKKAQIQRTIETHLDKELMLNPKGIKVLSLFFIDEVSKYRTDDDSIGLYAKMFEECYEEIISRPCYAELKAKYLLEGCHEGYFSKDKKGHLKNTKGDTVDDTTTYDLIMKNKEQLLSFSSPLRFIFSHSALKEGWDNPNVFQVCTLVEQKSTWTMRQKVGRGLRLCVNQDGERVDDKNINVLHVMASESFAEFADKLQKEIEKETGMRFGIVDIGLFEDLTVADKVEIKIEVVNNEIEITATENVVIPQEKIEEIKAQPIEIIQTKPVVEIEIERPATYEERKEIVEHFEKKDFIDKKGKIKDTMKFALEHDTLDLPDKYAKAKELIAEIIKSANKKVKLKNDADKVAVRLNKQVLISPEFLALWDRIKQKTTYRVKIDEQRLIDESVKQLKELPRFAKVRVVTKTAKIDVEKSGVGFTETFNRPILTLKTRTPKCPTLSSTSTTNVSSLGVRFWKFSSKAGGFVICAKTRKPSRKSL